MQKLDQFEIKKTMIELRKFDTISEYWMNYKDALHAYILKIVKDRDAANELSHQVLMKVYSSCCSGRSIRNIRAWLFQIAYNTCMDYFKKEGRTVELQKDVQQEEETVVYRDAAEFIEPLLNLLPQKYAEPLRMADIEGLPQQEVAKKLGLTHTAVKTRIQRARKLLKEQITDCFHLEVDREGQLSAFEVRASCEALQCYAAKQAGTNSL